MALLFSFLFLFKQCGEGGITTTASALRKATTTLPLNVCVLVQDVRFASARKHTLRRMKIPPSNRITEYGGLLYCTLGVFFFRASTKSRSPLWLLAGA